MRRPLFILSAISILAACQSQISEVSESEKLENTLTNGYILDYDSNPFPFNIPAANLPSVLDMAASRLDSIITDSIDSKISFGSPMWIDRINEIVESHYGIPNKKLLQGSNLDNRSLARTAYNSTRLVNYILLKHLNGSPIYDLMLKESQLVDSLTFSQNEFLRLHFQYQCTESPDSNSWRMGFFQEMEWQNLFQSMLMAVNAPQELATYPLISDNQIQSEYKRLTNKLDQITDSCYSLQDNQDALSIAHEAWNKLDQHTDRLSQALPDSVFDGMQNMLRFRQYSRLKNSFMEYCSKNYEYVNKLIKEDSLLK